LAPQFDAAVFRIQQELIEFGTEIADPANKQRIEHCYVQKFEKEIDKWEAILPPFPQFIIPGADRASAFLHLARTVCRRAERSLVSLLQAEPDVSATLLAYLNRLSDLLFVMARYEK
jgi:cob(I)alamin adenosyltransferase